MKVLHLSTSDVEHGAAKAAYRLHQGLQNIDVRSEMLVRAKFTLDKAVIPEKTIITKLGPPLSNLPLRFYSQRTTKLFSTQWFSDRLVQRVSKIDPDLVQLHWICNGFLQIESLAKFNKPLVWTLHDMWPFTGGCHYTQNCDRFQQTCGQCPQLNSKRSWDLSRWVWQRKARAWQKLNLTLVSPSHWLAEQAQKSSLLQFFPIKVIPHGLDLAKYKPVPQAMARQLLGLPPERKLVLFGASPGTTSDRRKGLQFLQPALQQLLQQTRDQELELVIFGATAPAEPLDLGFPVHYLGQFHDDISLALVYSAADVMVVPSMQEAFGQTASESLACGTPVVAFETTGLKDIVDHQLNGYLARPFVIEDLARGIAWVLEDRDRLSQLRSQARLKAEREFSLQLQANRYLALFEQIITDRYL
jgi:glycosyltransferase involved in cell wall biosynthesis